MRIIQEILSGVLSFGAISFATVIALSVLGCGRLTGEWKDPSSKTSGQSDFGSSSEIDTPPIASGPGGPDYSALDSAIFQPRCLSCHSQFASYTTLMEAKTPSGEPFILAGNAAGSAVHIETAAGRMPSVVPLSTDQTNAIRDWINAGAKPPESNGMPATPAPVPVADLEATWTTLVGPGGVMTNNCVSCHSGARPKGDLDLLNYSEARGSARDILKLINRSDKDVMPPAGPMIKAYRDTIASWVDRGAPR